MKSKLSRTAFVLMFLAAQIVSTAVSQDNLQISQVYDVDQYFRQKPTYDIQQFVKTQDVYDVEMYFRQKPLYDVQAYFRQKPTYDIQQFVKAKDTYDIRKYATTTKPPYHTIATRP